MATTFQLPTNAVELLDATDRTEARLATQIEERDKWVTKITATAERLEALQAASEKVSGDVEEAKQELVNKAHAAYLAQCARFGMEAQPQEEPQPVG